MKRLSLVPVVIALSMSTMGCKPKQLSKEEAQELLNTRVNEKFASPRCSLGVGSKVRDKTNVYQTTFFSRTKCTDAAKAANLITLAEPEKEGSANVYLTVAPQALVKCKESFDCVITAECGKTSLLVDAVTTEGRKATVAYNVKRDIPDVVTFAPANCDIKPLEDMVEHRKFTASLDDEGHWSIQN